jgi:hypothetical protein
MQEYEALAAMDHSFGRVRIRLGPPCRVSDKVTLLLPQTAEKIPAYSRSCNERRIGFSDAKSGLFMDTIQQGESLAGQT